LADIFEKDHFTAIMSWEDVKMVSDQGILIGSHTVDHVILDQVDTVAAREQLISSKKAIEEKTGKACLYFCYPNGNWNKEIVSLVKETGFVAAVTTDRGSNKIKTNLLTLHRVSFPEVQ
jgi:peptidoglycan/xylan/chitin deacetylase (PgdA/CDA1 family)